MRCLPVKRSQEGQEASRRAKTPLKDTLKRGSVTPKERRSRFVHNAQSRGAANAVVRRRGLRTRSVQALASPWGECAPRRLFAFTPVRHLSLSS